jgi:hypothetical protein
MAGHWESLERAGHAVDVFAPDEPRGDAALLVLPDQGARAAEVDPLTAALGWFRVPAIAPAGEGCWWLDRVEPAFDPALPPLQFLTEQVVPAIAGRFGVAPPNVKLLGWGAGGQGVLQLAYRRPREYPALAAIDPAIDFHGLYGRGTVIDELFASREAARQATAILRMQGVGWPRRQLIVADRQGFWFEGAERLEMKLRSMGIPVEADFTNSAGGDGRRFVEEHAGRAIEFLLTERATLPVVGPGGSG